MTGADLAQVQGVRGEPARPPARARWWTALACLLLALSASLAVATRMAQHPSLSPIDELQHVDYVYRVLDGGLVRTGDRVGEQARTDESCRGLDARGFRVPPCRGPHPVEAYQHQGFNTADIHPPVYYWVTAAAARAVHGLLGGSWFSAIRSTGALWLWAGLLLTWGAARRLSAPDRLVVPLLCALPWVLAVRNASVVVNPDAAALVAGAGVVLAALSFDPGRRRSWAWLAVAGAGATLLNPSNIVALLPAAVVLLARCRRARTPMQVLPAAVVGLAGVLAEVVWLVVRRAIAVPGAPTSPLTARATVTHLPLGDLLAQARRLTLPFDPLLTGDVRVSSASAVLVHLLSVALLAGLVAGVVRPPRPAVRPLALGVAVTLLVGAPLLALATYQTERVFFLVPPRYGLSLIPAIVLPLVARRERWVVAATAGLCGVLLVTALVVPP